MLQSFVIVLREGFEAFLIVAITLAYLRKTGRGYLSRAVHWGIVASIVASGTLGWVLLQGVNQSLWEGVLGGCAMVLVVSLVVHMWRTGPRMKREMETRLGEVSSRPTTRASFAGVFLFTLFMMSREGMETALMLLQLRRGSLLVGALAGLAGAATLAWAWARFGHLIDLRRFFQVTGIFLLLFVVQIGIYTFHEFSEAGVLPNSEALHAATEAYSPDGVYGQWFSTGMVAVCAAWLAAAWLHDRIQKGRGGPGEAAPAS